MFFRRFYSKVISNNKCFSDALFSQQKVLEIKLNHFKPLSVAKHSNIFLKFHRLLSNSSSMKNAVAVTKKRLPKKKQIFHESGAGLRIAAFSTAEEYLLENLSVGLSNFTAYELSKFASEFGTAVDVVHAVQEGDVPNETQELFFFRNGCVVMWNVFDSEIRQILKLLKKYEEKSFPENLIFNESEFMLYSLSDNVEKPQLVSDTLILPAKTDIVLEKYAVSNAIALSVHLGTYEASLEGYVETMKPVTEDLKLGNRIKMSRSEVLQKTGQLFALRHNISLNSDLLDTPDFYWDRAELENVYQTVFNYYCVNKRTRVINEKINHCIELVELLTSHLNDKHHIRLEWMIIVLIMVEVAFEVIHYIERYLHA